MERGAHSDDELAGPAGGVYEWYSRAMRLLAAGSPEAAATLLLRALDAEPSSHSVREALARALFDAHRYDEAAREFAVLVEQAPQEDYAWFGLGLTQFRLGRFAPAAEHLAMAVAMRPGRAAYVQALREARATLRARGDAAGSGPGAPGLPTEG